MEIDSKNNFAIEYDEHFGNKVTYLPTGDSMYTGHTYSIEEAKLKLLEELLR